MNQTDIARWFSPSRLTARREFLTSAAGAPTLAALSVLTGATGSHAADIPNAASLEFTTGRTAKAKRVISLFQSGAPSQLDLFDYKPTLNGIRSTELPDPPGSATDGNDQQSEQFSDRSDKICI
jgi:hypothetical protein